MTAFNDSPDFVHEPARSVPVIADAEVVVAGCGLSGVFAALAAARCGVRVVGVDRFGALGGHLGPGGVLAAGLLEWGPRRTVGAEFPALEQEVFDRVNAGGGAAYPVSGPHNGAGAGGHGKTGACGPDLDGENYPKQSAMFSHVVQIMLEEAGALILPSVYAGDPILEDGIVRGVFVETKSGRVAVRSEVVVDGTGDADLAFRAGAPTISGVAPRSEWSAVVTQQRLNAYYRIWNECGLFFVVGGVDWNVWESYASTPYALTDDEIAWEVEIVGRTDGRIPRKLIPALKKAHERGEYTPRVQVSERVYIYGGVLKHGGHRFRHLGSGLVSSNMQAFGEVDTGDALLVAVLEREIRSQIFKTVEFLRSSVPAFRDAYLFSIAPYMGSRGGRCIEAEYTLTVEDMLRGAKFPDVIYQNRHEVERSRQTGGAAPTEPYDVPYRITLPRGIDGLLVTGTGAGFIRRGHDPSSMRAKCSMMLLGHAVGTAAALAADARIAPRRLDRSVLQRALLADGFTLGDERRPAEPGICRREGESASADEKRETSAKDARETED